MNKPEVIKAYATKAGISQVEAKKRIETAVEFIAEVLEVGEEINLSGVIKIGVKERAAREYKNPQNLEEVVRKEATSIPYVQFGKALKDAAAKAL